MLAALRRKARAREENGDVAFDRCEAVRLPLDRLDRLVPGREGLYDGAIADFGSLNCVADLEELARSLERLVRPGGWVVAAVMNRTCLTETLHFLLRLKPRSAARRWRRGPAEVPLGSHRVRVRYLTPGSFAASFSDAFGVARCTAHPLLVPPPYLARMFAEDPARLDRWIRWDRRLAVRSWAAALGDHFLIEMVRNNDAVAPTEREHA
jgi:SAM-dependent methyltransferase